MKLKHLLLITFCLLSYSSIHATIVQTMVLKNGSELEGYISTQRPGKDFTFIAQKAVVYVTGVSSYRDNEINIKKLSPEWVEWAQKNDAFEGVGDNRILTLSDIYINGKVINQVRVLEKGAKVKYLALGNNSFSLNWDTIAVVKAEKRPKTALSGINRIYKLDNGQEIEGQYVEEVPGKTLSLYRDNGVVEVFETDKVVKYSMKKINPNQDLFEQSKLIDVVRLKNDETYRGIIIEQNFNSKDAIGDYLLIQTENGETKSVQLAEVTEYGKEVNPKYKPLFDILLRPGELVINRQATHEVKVSEEGSYIIIQPCDSCMNLIKSKESVTKISIETRFENDTQDEAIEIVKIKEIPIDRKKKNFIWGFTYKDIVKSNIRPVKVQTSINSTYKSDYEFSDEGIYAIYNAKKKSAILFKIM